MRKFLTVVAALLLVTGPLAACSGTLDHGTPESLSPTTGDSSAK